MKFCFKCLINYMKKYILFHIIFFLGSRRSFIILMAHRFRITVLETGIFRILIMIRLVEKREFYPQLLYSKYGEEE